MEDRYGRSSAAVQELDDDEAAELLGALLELRGIFRNLQWFGEVNRQGFVKITKKLDKKIPGSAIQSRYITTRVDPKPFAKDTAVARILTEINKWLSITGDAQSAEDSKSDRSARSLERASSKAMLGLSEAIVDGLDAAIKAGDADLLEVKLKQGALVSTSLPTQIMLLKLLQRCISARSKSCISCLLQYIRTLDEPDDINQRNCIHRLVIHIGRAIGRLGESVIPGETSASIQFTIPSGPRSLSSSEAINDDRAEISIEDEGIHTLSYLLDNLSPVHKVALASRDALGRFPIHYAAHYGCAGLCEALYARMTNWDLLGSFAGIDSPEWHDQDGHAPVHLAVLGGHVLCTRALLEASSRRMTTEASTSATSHVLAIATKADSREIVQLLVDAGANVNWKDGTGDTALHVAARFGHRECAQILINAGADVEAAETIYSWSPLHVAAVDGHFHLVELLVNSGADVLRRDMSGWNAKEHAALRGHLRIAEYLDDRMDSSDVAPLAQDDDKINDSGSSLGDRHSKQAIAPEPLKTFGHRYLQNESLILVSLGSMDMRKKVEAVELDQIPLSSAHSTQLDTALSIVVSASGASGQPTTINLPVHENISTEPVAFTALDLEKVRLFFDIVPTYIIGDSGKNKVARAVALLEAVRPRLGSTHGERASLVGDATAPLVEINDLEVVGAVHFNLLVITPFKHPNMEVTSEHTYWKKAISSPREPMVIGHRGLGKNLAENKSLQLGENTVQSIIAAASLGANYVEFDVQLTKDHVPVIYHDFFVSETGIDAPVHTLTLEQFMHMNEAASSRRAEKDSVNGSGSIYARVQKIRRTNSPGPRTRSLSQEISGTADGLSATDERMKHTRDFKVKGFKANTRGNFIQAPFATLSQLLDQIPEETGFNIEMKYPMLHESQEHEMDAYAVELNRFVDVVLALVYEKMGDRQIIFSSFNPDICLCLSFKQPSIPVLFLTNATADEADTKISDIRASSLQEAVRFASRWNLLGVVAHAEVFQIAPSLVRVVKGMGLVCVSYGVLNNDPSNVQVSQSLISKSLLMSASQLTSC